MNRDNETWVLDLGASESTRERAISDLRSVLLRGLRRILSDRGNVDEPFLEDTVQDALLRILDRLDQFAGRSRFLTWATSISIRVALSELRRKRWQDVSLDAINDDCGITPDAAIDRGLSPEKQVEQIAIIETLNRVIETALTDKQRKALLAELKGMPQDEIARHLGSNRNAVYKLTHDARKRLKKGIEDAGYASQDIHAAFAD